jgi:hypothetical protein
MRWARPYTLAALPDEATLRTDLQTAVRAYRALTYRGGIEGDVETQSEISDEFNIPPQASVVEIRKYVYHRKIERNRTAAKNAKKFHGTTCQACKLDFGKRYGDIGEGFIEAHHLKPIGALDEGVPVKYDGARGGGGGGHGVGGGFGGSHFGDSFIGGRMAGGGYGGYGDRVSGLHGGFHHGYERGDVWGHWGRYYAKAPRPNHHFGQRRRI